MQSLFLEDLKAIAKHCQIQPLGNQDQAESWINVLLRFPYRAIDQMRDGVGLRSPGNNAVLYLKYILNLIGEPTDNQFALIRATQNDEWLKGEEWQFYQEKLFELYRVRLLLKEALKILVD
ncbi:hypothetical protein [Fischerella sp. JS2]|uniref:hypothetical protein n=1 Tax=Fischerella sp. JS2 TaxID=2597771 RepID=UPI0028E59990|nr:hypothetical protein [Fischerella sp. JS2]